MPPSRTPAVVPAVVADPLRLAALDDYHVLDTPPEEDFDNIVQLATQLCAVPVALVSFVAKNRQWFKARVGFPPCETDLSSSVCAHALAEPDVLVIPDLTLDPRTAENPLVVGSPFIRFYAGAPLTTPQGVVLGALCVIDTNPRPTGLTTEQRVSLKTLARQVMLQLEFNRAIENRGQALAAKAGAEEQLRLATQAAGIGVWDLNLPTGELRWDARVRELFGVPERGPVTYEGSFLANLHPDDRELTDAAVQAALDPSGDQRFDIEYRTVAADTGRVRWVAARGQGFAEDGRTVRFIGTVRDVTARRAAEAAVRETEERYRLAARAATNAVWDWDLIANHVTWSEALESAHGHAPADVVSTGGWWIDHIHPEDRARIDASIHAVIDGDGAAWFDTYRFHRADGSYAHIHDRGFLIRDAAGRAVRMVGAMLDVTEEKRAERRTRALLDLGDRLRGAATVAEAIGIAAETIGPTLSASRAGYARVDLVADMLDVERDWTAPGVVSLEGRYALDGLRESMGALQSGQTIVAADGEAPEWRRSDRQSRLGLGTRAQVMVPLVDHGALVGLLYAHQTGARDWTAEDVGFIQGVADRTYAAIVKLRADADQRVLNEELSHRLKNTLAMVLSIATQTLRTVADRAPVEAFEHRIHALSSAHDVLLRRSWAAAPIHAVIRAVMAGAGHVDRIDASGPDVELGPRATLSTSLLLHELTTNAAKYGALTEPTGRIAMSWRIEGSGDVAELVLDWVEQGGPSPVAPSVSGRKGFGSRLIRMGLVGTGGVALRYPETGFQASLRAPLAQLQQS